MSLAPLDELALLLRPSGGGVYLVSTGRAEQQALQRKLYGAASEAEVHARFLDRLRAIATAKGVLLAVPSDTGAGFRRGANLGPQGVRTAILDRLPDFAARADRAGIVDLGDVVVVPQLQHDAMLSAAQLAATRAALYPGLDPVIASSLPVSPLSIAERVWELVFRLNPGVRPFVIGGDHSTAWPVVAALAKARKDWGIVQIDAHTDLLEERLGVKYCFATWSFHANELLGRRGRLVQVGIRATRHPREHWERTLGVRQFWADDARARGEAMIDEIVAAVKASGVRSIYFSNDIDGTDASEAEATGTPEPGGLTSAFVHALIARFGAEVGVLGGDVMEVAPPLGPTPDAAQRTCRLGADYLLSTIEASLGAAI